jgi:hypothetical protein
MIQLSKKFVLLMISTSILISVLPGTSVMAQSGHSLYFMKGVPQSNMLNPAYQPGCNFYLGLPGFSPLQIGLQNDPLVVHDVFYYDASLDSTITFLHPNADADKFLSVLKKVNFIEADVNTSLISFGFRVKSLYFSFGVNTKAFARVDYPKDLMRIPLYGTLDPLNNPVNIDLSGTSIQATAYNELSMGVSKKFGDMLNIGVRGKVLFGLANMYTRQTDITVNTALDMWEVNSLVDMNASIPFVNIPTDSTGKFNFDSITTNDPSRSEIMSKGLFHPNFGLALDAGVEYKPFSWLTVSASVVDLGFIRWRNDIHNLSQDATYLFNGVDLSSMIRGDTTTDAGQDLLDTLQATFTYTTLANPYSTYLPTKVYLGGTFNLSEKYSFGLLSISEIYNHHWRQSFSVSANLMPFKGFSTTLAYSLLHNRYHDLGLGFSFKTGPTNMYMVFDYIPTSFDKYHMSNMAIPVPFYSSSFSIKLGFNLLFGCNAKKKLQKDVPLIE